MPGRIAQSFINDLLDRIDIVPLIDERVKLKRAGRNYTARCPFHEEKTPSFSVNAERQFYHCFGCGVSGTALTFLLEHDRLDFVSAIELLASRAGVPIEYEDGQAPRVNQQRDQLFDVVERTAKLYEEQLRTPAGAPARKYLKQRGVDGATAKRFGLGVAPPGWDNLLRAFADNEAQFLAKAGLVIERDRDQGSNQNRSAKEEREATERDKRRHYDRFRDRVMFPIRNFRGRVIGFGGRVLGDGEPKYLNSPETPIFHKGEEVYGLFEARRATRQLTRLVLVEGYMDVVALAQAGITEAVATLGTATTPEQLTRLFRLVPEVVLCYDGDRAGRAAAWKALTTALPLVTDEQKLAFIFLPDGDDPDSLVRREGAEAFRALMDGAQPLVDYLFSHLSEGFDLETIDDRAAFARKAEGHIQTARAGIRKSLMTQRLAELVGLGDARPGGGRTQSGGRAAGDGGRPDDGTAPGAPGQRMGQQRMGGPPRRGPLGGGTLGRQGEADQALVWLLQRPTMALELSDAVMAALGQHDNHATQRLVRMLGYLRANPDSSDLGAILGYLHGEPDYEAVLQLANSDVQLGPDAVRTEFKAAIDGVLAAAARVERRASAQALTTDDDLRAYMEQLVDKRR